MKNLMALSVMTMLLFSCAIIGISNDVCSATISKTYDRTVKHTSQWLTEVSSAYDCQNVSFAGRWAEGPCYRVEVQDDIAYFDNGGNLEIVNVSNPGSLEWLGRIVLGNHINDIAVFGTYAYVATDGRLVIVDISLPANPVEMGSYPGMTWGVAANDSIAYVAAYYHGLRILDVSDPGNPFLVATVDTLSGWTQDVVVRDNYAFVADDQEGLRIVDVSIPASPVVVGSIDTYYQSYDVAISGGHSLVADGMGGIRIIDISDPTGPSEESRLVYNRARGVAEQYSFAYLASLTEGLRVIDFSDPVNPNEVGYFISGGEAQSVSASGCYVYVAGGDDGLWILQNDLAVNPLIMQIADIANDQGRQVRLQWRRSLQDAPGGSYNIIEYALFRRQDELRSLGDSVATRNGKDSIIENFRLEGWDYLCSVPAFGEETYQCIVPTLCDSTATGGVCWSIYFVRATTHDPFTFFDSPPDSGYSVDNIAPGVPQAILAGYLATGVTLDWDDAPEVDFQFYRIYRGADAGFVPSPGNIIHETAASAWTDPATNPWGHYYKVTTLDYAGNESEAASPGSVTGVQDGTVPTRTTLLAAVPNPFNPSTKLSFKMATSGNVQLKVYDAAGHLVATLVDEYRDVGRHEVIWDGRDALGRMSSAGVYLYRLKVGGYSESKRMVLIK